MPTPDSETAEEEEELSLYEMTTRQLRVNFIFNNNDADDEVDTSEVKLPRLPKLLLFLNWLICFHFSFHSSLPIRFCCPRAFIFVW